MKSYDDHIHTMGRTSGLIALFFIFLVPSVVCVYFNIFPPFKNLLSGIFTVTMIYLFISTAEVITYTPMLGSGASYLVFVTGNLTNLKIPCVLMCMDKAKVKPQTEEGEVIATISAAISSIVTVLVVLIGMLAITPLTPLLSSPELKPAFENILPALFGALGCYWLMKQWKLAVIPIAVSVLLFKFAPIPNGATGALIPVLGLVSVISGRIMYKKGWIKEA